MEEVYSRLEDKSIPTRLSLAIASVILDASNYNLNLLREALKASGAAGGSVL
jgi:hypothetical protein